MGGDLMGFLSGYNKALEYMEEATAKVLRNGNRNDELEVTRTLIKRNFSGMEIHHRHVIH